MTEKARQAHRGIIYSL